MTKIPSVEIKRESQDTWEIRYGEKLIGGLFLHDLPRFLNDILTQALTDQRLALLTELMDSELLEEQKVNICGFNFKGVTVETKDAVEIIFAYEKIGHNTLARAIKAHLDELIKSNNV